MSTFEEKLKRLPPMLAAPSGDRCGEVHPGFPDMPCMRAKGHAGEHCPVEGCQIHAEPEAGERNQHTIQGVP